MKTKLLFTIMVDLLKKNLSLLTISLLSLQVGHSQTNVSGGIFTNTIWTLANSPYIVTDTVVVFPNVTLSIEPGVIVKLYDDKFIEIRGGLLLASGTMNDSILFTSNSSNPTMGIWKGIYLNSNSSVEFNYCNIEYANSSILYLSNSYPVSIQFNNCSFKENNTGFSREGNNEVSGTVDHCFFKNNNTAIDGMGYGTQVISNSTFTANDIGISGYGNTTTIINCNFCYHSIAAIQNARGIINCNIHNNNIGVSYPADSIVNSIICYNSIGIDYYTSLELHINGNSICNNTLYNFKNNSSPNLIIDNNCWCDTDSANISQKIYDGYDNINLGLVDFTPYINCDSTDLPDTVDCSILPTGIYHPTLSENTFVKIFPNPFSQYATIEFENFKNGKKHLTVFNYYGQLLLSIDNITSGQIKIDRTNLTNGLYFFQLRSDKEVVAIGKFIIE